MTKIVHDSRLIEKISNALFKEDCSYDLNKLEKTAEFYYHGTNSVYFKKQIKNYRKYQHDNLKIGTEICIALNPDTSKLYAIDRNPFPAVSDPIVLKIFGQKVRCKVHNHRVTGDLVIPFLLPNEYEILEVKK